MPFPTIKASVSRGAKVYSVDSNLSKASKCTWTMLLPCLVPPAVMVVPTMKATVSRGVKVYSVDFKLVRDGRVGF